MILANAKKTCTPIEQLFLTEMYQEDTSYLIIGECDDSMIDSIVDDISEPGLFDNEIDDFSDLDDDEYTYDGDEYFAFDIDDEDDIF